MIWFYRIVTLAAICCGLDVGDYGGVIIVIGCEAGLEWLNATEKKKDDDDDHDGGIGIPVHQN